MLVPVLSCSAGPVRSTPLRAVEAGPPSRSSRWWPPQVLIGRKLGARTRWLTGLPRRRTRPSPAPAVPGGGPLQRGSELGPRGDVQLREDLVKVVADGARAQRQPLGYLPVAEAFGGQQRDPVLLRRPVVVRFGALGFPGGAQFGVRPLVPRGGAEPVEELLGDPEVLAGLLVALAAAQPGTELQLQPGAGPQPVGAEFESFGEPPLGFIGVQQGVAAGQVELSPASSAAGTHGGTVRIDTAY